ncbi:ABC transporter ATP-binding protein [Granulosicoccus sp. 3-233]|uniref:ABC transporter ATP-binding protein n=1 Tax=Granulosicoccus sp. 3-233 TaxID=3417969 RepID=UPI003D34CE24
MNCLLDVGELQAWYGLTQVLFNVDLRIEQGQVVSLMGRNGMGKSSTINAICAMVDRREGRIDMQGKSIMALPSHRIAQAGIGLVPEGRRVFANLSVRENLVAAATRGEWDLARVYRLFPRLEERHSQSAATLSGGEQQMLVIGRALMTNPRLLILDEATEGLAPIIRQEIWAAIRALKANGMSILLVDKTVRELLSVADHCFILEKGATIWSGRPEQLSTEIADSHLGV